MIEIKLNQDKISKIQNFVNSKLYNETTEKSELWKHESSLASVEFKNKGKLILKGSGGLYFRRTNSLKRALSKIKSNLENFIKGYPVFTSHKKAFDLVMQNKKTRGELEYNFNKNFRQEYFKDYSFIKKNNPFKSFDFDYYETKHYYLINILRTKIDFNKINSILEIGGGSGHFPILFKSYHANLKQYFSIDLPQILIFNIIFTMNFFPSAKFCLPNEFEKIQKDELNNFDFIFLTPNQINTLGDDIVDLTINTSSFAEMNKKDIVNYFELAQRATKNAGYFFNHNRVHKLPEPHSEIGEKIRHKLEANIFSDYPFRKNNKLLIYDICRLSQFLKIDPMMVRLEEINKSDEKK